MPPLPPFLFKVSWIRGAIKIRLISPYAVDSWTLPYHTPGSTPPPPPQNTIVELQYRVVLYVILS